jgi:hypothetical protein
MMYPDQNRRNLHVPDAGAVGGGEIWWAATIFGGLCMAPDLRDASDYGTAHAGLAQSPLSQAARFQRGGAMNWKLIWSGFAGVVMIGAIATAQTSVTKTLTAPVTETVTITAIDQTARLVMVKTSKGVESAVYAGPDIKRFSELKVGQQVEIRYYESVVYALAQPDQKTAPLTVGEAVTPAAGGAPGATVAQQMKAVVDVVAVDPAVPSITVRTAKGHTITRKVENPKNLAAVKPGDRLVITYTEAVLLQVK